MYCLRQKFLAVMEDIEKKRAAETKVNLLHIVLVGFFFCSHCCVAEIALKSNGDMYLRAVTYTQQCQFGLASQAKLSWTPLAFKPLFSGSSTKNNQPRTKKVSAEDEVADHMNQVHK